jgi:hypothetical protein
MSGRWEKKEGRRKREKKDGRRKREINKRID